MKTMKKEVVEKWGRKFYLLGIRKKDNKKVWLEDFSFECGWYWGGGYVEVFTSNNPEKARDIQEYAHFDMLFLKNPFHSWEEYFKTSVLTDKEVWRLLDLMKQFYALRDCAEVYQYGGHMTNEGRTEEEIDKKMSDKINEHIEKVIIPLVRKIFESG
jgi:hypothetical protein